MLAPCSTLSTPILEFNQPIVCFVNTEEQWGSLNESSDSSDSISGEDEEIEGQPIPRPKIVSFHEDSFVGCPNTSNIRKIQIRHIH